MTSDPWGYPSKMDSSAFQQWLDQASVEDIEGFASARVPERYLSTSVLTERVNSSMKRVEGIMSQQSRVRRWLPPS
jgi:hypothetical protein